MSTFQALSKTITKLEKTSKKIISKSLDIMKQLTGVDCDTIEDYLETVEQENVNREQVLQRMQEISLGWVEDAEKVHKELPKFVTEAEDGTFRITENTEDCPFLLEVWNGDVYDQTDLVSLNMLLKTLETQLSNISTEYLITQTIGSLQQ